MNFAPSYWKRAHLVQKYWRISQVYTSRVYKVLSIVDAIAYNVHRFKSIAMQNIATLNVHQYPFPVCLSLLGAVPPPHSPSLVGLLYNIMKIITQYLAISTVIYV